MNKYDILFISPHLDDVVYSCSQLIRYINNNRKILVVSVFTQYREGTNNVFTDGKKRFEEDKNAMESLGLNKIYLNYPELMIRENMKEYSLYNQIIEPLKTLFYCKNDNYLTYSINYDIQKIINDYNIISVYIPAAIGFHPDHILTYRACYNLKNTTLFMYEDFPYCINNIFRNMRLPFLKWYHNFKDEKKIKVNVEEKMEDLMKYESQYDVIFEDNDLSNILKDYYETYYYI